MQRVAVCLKFRAIKLDLSSNHITFQRYALSKRPRKESREREREGERERANKKKNKKSTKRKKLCLSISTPTSPPTYRAEPVWRLLVEGLR